MNPYTITQQETKITKNKKMKQITLQVHRTDQTEIKYKDFSLFVNKLLKEKKKTNQQILIRGLSKLGWLTYVSYNQNSYNDNGDDDYLNGRVSESASDSFTLSQFQIIIMEKQT